MLWQEPFSQRIGASPENSTEQLEWSPGSLEHGVLVGCPPEPRLQDRVAQEHSQTTRGNEDAEQWPRNAGRWKGLAATSVCLAAGCPRSTAISNSKACWLQEVRNKSCAASEGELPVGIAAFYIRLAHQLSPCEKTPTSTPPGTWQTAVCGWVYASHYSRPRAQRHAGRFSVHGCQVGSAWTFGQFHIQAPVLPEQRGYRYMEARTLRAVFQVFFCNACA